MTSSEESPSQSLIGEEEFGALSLSRPHHRSSRPSPSRRRRKQRFRNKQRKDINFISLLPDETLEMCLVRLPFPTLLTARQVCKKWRDLTTTPYFLQMRHQASHHTPWFFLFGAIRLGGYATTQIYASPDVSLDQWYKIDPGHFLRNRYNFSPSRIIFSLLEALLSGAAFFTGL